MPVRKPLGFLLMAWLLACTVRIVRRRHQGTTLIVPASGGLLSNDTDPDGDTLSVVSATPPSHGDSAVLSDGSFVYEVDPTLSGTDSLSYQATDGALLSNIATVTITVNPVCATDITHPFASTDLQSVIDAATTGDTIDIRGTCTGNFAIGKDLTLVGISGTSPTLDGHKTGRVLTVFSRTSVTLTDLTITNGTAEFGGGIINSGTVT